VQLRHRIRYIHGSCQTPLASKSSSLGNEVEAEHYLGVETQPERARCSCHNRPRFYVTHLCPPCVRSQGIYLLYYPKHSIRAFQADQRALAQTLHDAYVNSTTHLAQLAQNLGRSQDSVLADISDVNFFFDKLLVTLGAVREEVAALGERLELGLMKTHLDIAAIRQQLREFQTVAATTTTVERTAEFTQATVERVGISTQQTVESIGMSTLESIKGLEVEVQQGFATISAHCSAVSRHQRDQKQVAARLMANPLISEFARLLHSRDRRQIYGATARQSDLMGQPVMSSILRLPREAISPPVIVCTFLLALRANTASERATYAIFSFLLFVTRNMLRLYKFPAVSRCVIIVDIFYWAKATVSDVKSSTVSIAPVFNTAVCSNTPAVAPAHGCR